MTRMTFLTVLVMLNLSCIEKKPAQKQTNIPAVIANVKTDTLKFTSAIRAIYQDSKNNYWFGSHSEGLSVYNGQSFEYFTTNEGLSDNQIRSIQEDDNGKIWIGTAKGTSVYNKEMLTNYPTKTDETKDDWNKTMVIYGFMRAKKMG